METSATQSNIATIATATNVTVSERISGAKENVLQVIAVPRPLVDSDYTSEWSSSSSSSSSESIAKENVQKCKKRMACPMSWKKAIAKRCRNSGLQYISSSKSKKFFPAKQLGPPCNDRCRLKCFSKFTEEERKAIFSDYWKMASLQRQRDFLAGNIDAIKPKYQYIKADSNRSYNNASISH